MSCYRALGQSAALLIVGVSSVHAATITVFDPAASGGTYPRGINDDGYVTGGWFDTAIDLGEGFIRAPDGTITTFVMGNVHPKETSANALNDRVDITGYVRQHGSLWGFVRTARGKFRTFLPQDHRGAAYPEGITRDGTVAGMWSEPRRNDQAFVRTVDGALTLFDVSGDDTGAVGINGNGAVVGDYTDSSGAEHGFVRSPDGSITTFDAGDGAIGTFAQAINNSGTTTGYYMDGSEVYHGFLRETDGTATTFDPPGSLATYAASINDKGVITGSYWGTDNTLHGFVRAADGTITAFDPTGSKGTSPSSINRNGEITGTFYDSSGQYHGFVRSR